VGLQINTILVNTADKLVLIDAGCGVDKFQNTNGKLLGHLASAGWTCLGKVESSSEGKRSISWASRSDGSGRNLRPKPFGWLR
jgi:hypothetical protein